jgi:hypothetical protein
MLPLLTQAELEDALVSAKCDRSAVMDHTVTRNLTLTLQPSPTPDT